VAGDPAVWTIIDGRLYLNHSAPLADLWEADYDALRRAADAEWREAVVADDR